MRIQIAFIALGASLTAGTPPTVEGGSSDHTGLETVSLTDEQAPNPTDVVAVVSLYLAKRELMTHTRPDLAICDSMAQRVLRPEDLERIAKSGAGRMLDKAACIPNDPDRSGTTLRIGSIQLRSTGATIRATAETPALLWGEVAEVAGPIANRYLKRISFEDWLVD